MTALRFSRTYCATPQAKAGSRVSIAFWTPADERRSPARPLRPKEHGMFRHLSIAALAATIAFAPVAQACTGIQLTAKDGGVVAARTLEFGIDLQSNVLVIPAGTAFTGTLPNGGAGIRYTTKYGMVGANGADMTVIVDGINDQGLYVGLFYFPGTASYSDATAETAARGMAPWEYGTWLLGNFATVDEVRANFDKVVLTPVVLDLMKQVPGVHFVVHDRSGKAVAIEPLEKTLRLFDNPFGVMTNSPSFDWHMTNLRNYINLSPKNVGHIDVGTVKLEQFGSGSGMHGLPGDFTPPSRFVRAVAFSKTAIPSNTAQQSVVQAFHILNDFDIPLGSVREIVDGQVVPEYTTWTAASDLKNLRWHFRTFADQTIHSVDVRAALAAAGGKIRTIPMQSQQPIVDVSTNFK
jgi:choloylglycine hydrolase